MKLRASTLAAAGIAPLLLVVALTLSMTTFYTHPGSTAAQQATWSAFVWAFLAAAAVAMATAGWAWISEADRAPGRLGLGYTGALALGMIVFVSVQTYLF
ncbi:hypothetical protein [Demequina salsinemoris]|uniref:hypothetical protein n=1 Tax=Demequina salsinemoris TaxID=577470 RepID=UPI000783D287|nr:hypothetical protein [Demequina salsinemoris]